MPSTIQLENDIILHTLDHDLTALTLKGDLKYLQKYADELRNHHKPILLLVDATKARKTVSAKLREQALTNLATLQSDRVAVFGLNPYMLNIAKWILWVSRNEHVVHIAKSKEEACAWLKASNS
jgi:hypothetical protein